MFGEESSFSQNFSFHQHVWTLLNGERVDFQVLLNVYLCLTRHRTWQVCRCVSNTKTRNQFLSLATQNPTRVYIVQISLLEKLTPQTCHLLSPWPLLWMSGFHRQVPLFVNTSQEDSQGGQVCLSGWVMGAFWVSQWADGGQEKPEFFESLGTGPWKLLLPLPANSSWWCQSGRVERSK